MNLPASVHLIWAYEYRVVLAGWLAWDGRPNSAKGIKLDRYAIAWQLHRRLKGTIVHIQLCPPPQRTTGVASGVFRNLSSECKRGHQMI